MADSTGRRLFRRRPTAEPVLPAPTEAPTPVPVEPAAAAPRSGPRGERTVTVAVRLTPAEHARWTAAATEGGRGQMGRWVRETVTARLDGRPVPAPVASDVVEQLAALRAELSKVGSNLNQVARALNVQARGGPVQISRDTVGQVIAATRGELGRMRDQLGGLR